MLRLIRKNKTNHVATKNSVDMSLTRQKPQVNNAFFTHHTLSTNVRKLYTDVDGAVIDKNTIPTNLKVSIPVYLLGAFDMDGGYRLGYNIVPPKPTTKYLMSFINGMNATSANITGFSGLNDIQSQLGVGDMVHVLTDDVTNPNYYIWIVIAAGNTPYSAIVSNLKTTQQDKKLGDIFIKEINYLVSDDEQYKEAIHFTTSDNLGNFRDDSINPLMFKDPFVEQEDFLTIKTQVLMNQYIGVNLLMKFTTDNMTLDFKIKMIN